MMYNNTESIDIKTISNILLRGWKLILLLGVIGLGISFVITQYLISPRYVSNIQLYVNNNNSASAQVPSDKLNTNDLAVSQKLVNTYIVILKNDETLEKVSDILMSEFSKEQLEESIGISSFDGKTVVPTGAIRNALTLSSVNETEILEIHAETGDPNVSASICTAVTKVAPEILQRVVKAGSVEVIGEAKPNKIPASPNVKTNSAIGLLLGVVLAVAFIILRSILDNTVKNEEDIKSIVDIPLLGIVPDFEGQMQNGGYSYGK